MRVRGLVVVDDRGIERIRLGAPLPDAVINGKRISRGQTDAGILLYDSSGNERSGYATFNQSGYVVLTLDTRHSQVASFAADPERGVAVKVWDRKDIVALTAYVDVANIRIIKRDSIYYQMSPKTKAP